MRRQHMLKSNQEPKNKILNIYLNCQPRSNEPVPVPVPVSTISSHIFIINSNKNFQSEGSEGYEDCEENDLSEILFVIFAHLYSKRLLS